MLIMISVVLWEWGIGGGDVHGECVSYLRGLELAWILGGCRSCRRLVVDRKSLPGGRGECGPRKVRNHGSF
ncbi:hypothetical protein BU24DRAFT_141736 [Aaosphaeria arxii CBS 175.79]|uniref:Uncharacterized protein n=1 Tax=Aaosphaeria arxii CBS 175.79 TaxID=1450172 RepID=A0A6A5XUU7_9PLEO|nr:uncharacterized protein BU24DRAFT_141736 [Aaosphaeria arxii CBS 175.79]KAF2016992.1 hypothetical protein BU24DRAFT_141736 [Aaosphaeria arxii CBS 175.79]